jgi:hypothetical protein
MCQTMGPKTDLGKFLKALKIAEFAAFLIELGNLNEHGIEGLLSDLQHWGAHVIKTFDNLFVSGGGTLADVISSTGA